jgi:hypothetical protein
MDTLFIASALLAPIGVGASLWLALTSPKPTRKPHVLMGYRR